MCRCSRPKGLIVVDQYKKLVKRDYVWVGDDKIVSGKAAR